MSEGRYLKKEEIHNLLGELQTPQGFSLVSTDSYNEEAIAEKIKALGQEARQQLFEATLNNAIIGYGQKNFGLVKIEEKYLEISDIYQKFGVNLTTQSGENLAEDELTPNRLIRFFRHYIRDWIKEHKTGSFMWRKYSVRDPTMMHICFRGAEHLEDLSRDEADYLIQTTVNMDRVLGTTMVDRVLRSFDARGQIYSPIPGQAVLSPHAGGQLGNQPGQFLPQYQQKHPPVLPRQSENVVKGVHGTQQHEHSTEQSFGSQSQTKETQEQKSPKEQSSESQSQTKEAKGKSLPIDQPMSKEAIGQTAGKPATKEARG